MEKNFISGYLLECGHLDWMTDVNHRDPIESWHIDFLWHRQNWFISDTENLSERIQQIVLEEMENVRKNDELDKPKHAWLVGSVQGEFPQSERIAADIASMIESDDFVGCVYKAGRKSMKGFILTKAIMFDEKHFKLCNFETKNDEN